MHGIRAHGEAFPSMGSLREAYPATPEAAGLARAAVREHVRAHGADEESVAAIALAVTEAVTNVVVHAYRDRDEPGEVCVEVEAHAGEGGALVTVSDCGLGMAPRLDSPGLGLGLPLIGSIAAGLEVRTPDGGGTELCMRFSFGTPEPCAS